MVAEENKIIEMEPLNSLLNGHVKVDEPSNEPIIKENRLKLFENYFDWWPLIWLCIRVILYLMDIFYDFYVGISTIVEGHTIYGILIKFFAILSIVMSYTRSGTREKIYKEACKLICESEDSEELEELEPESEELEELEELELKSKERRCGGLFEILMEIPLIQSIIVLYFHVKEELRIKRFYYHIDNIEKLKDQMEIQRWSQKIFQTESMYEAAPQFLLQTFLIIQMNNTSEPASTSKYVGASLSFLSFGLSLGSLWISKLPLVFFKQDKYWGYMGKFLIYLFGLTFFLSRIGSWYVMRKYLAKFLAQKLFNETSDLLDTFITLVFILAIRLCFMSIYIILNPDVFVHVDKKLHLRFKFFLKFLKNWFVSVFFYPLNPFNWVMFLCVELEIFAFCVLYPNISNLDYRISCTLIWELHVIIGFIYLTFYQVIFMSKDRSFTTALKIQNFSNLIISNFQKNPIENLTTPESIGDYFKPILDLTKELDNFEENYLVRSKLCKIDFNINKVDFDCGFKDNLTDYMKLDSEFVRGLIGYCNLNYLSILWSNSQIERLKDLCCSFSNLNELDLEKLVNYCCKENMISYTDFSCVEFDWNNHLQNLSDPQIEKINLFFKCSVLQLTKSELNNFVKFCKSKITSITKPQIHMLKDFVKFDNRGPWVKEQITKFKKVCSQDLNLEQSEISKITRIYKQNFLLIPNEFDLWRIVSSTVQDKVVPPGSYDKDDDSFQLNLTYFKEICIFECTNHLDSNDVQKLMPKNAHKLIKLCEKNFIFCNHFLIKDLSNCFTSNDNNLVNKIIMFMHKHSSDLNDFENVKDLINNYSDFDRPISLSQNGRNLVLSNAPLFLLIKQAYAVFFDHTRKFLDYFKGSHDDFNQILAIYKDQMGFFLDFGYYIDDSFELPVYSFNNFEMKAQNLKIFELVPLDNVTPVSYNAETGVTIYPKERMANVAKREKEICKLLAYYYADFKKSQ